MTKQIQTVEPILSNEVNHGKLNDWEKRFYKRFGEGVNYLAPSPRVREFIADELAQAQQEAYKAGQKSREKERLFNKAEWEHLYSLVKHDNYTGDYYGNKDQYYRRGKRIYKKLQQIKSLSLTKESK